MLKRSLRWLGRKIRCRCTDCGSPEHLEMPRNNKNLKDCMLVVCESCGPRYHVLIY